MMAFDLIDKSIAFEVLMNYQQNRRTRFSELCDRRRVTPTVAYNTRDALILTANICVRGEVVTSMMMSAPALIACSSSSRLSVSTTGLPGFSSCCNVECFSGYHYMMMWFSLMVKHQKQYGGWNRHHHKQQRILVRCRPERFAVSTTKNFILIATLSA